MNDKKLKYQKKEVCFGGKKHVLWSIDGNTWSSRKDELVNIQERHENEKITFGEIKGIAPKKFPPRKAAPGADTERIELTTALEEEENEIEFVSEEDDSADKQTKKTGKKSLTKEVPQKKSSGKKVVEVKGKVEKSVQTKATPGTGKAAKTTSGKGLPKKSTKASSGKKGKEAVASPKKRQSAGPQQGKSSKAKQTKQGKKAGKKAA